MDLMWGPYVVDSFDSLKDKNHKIIIIFIQKKIIIIHNDNPRVIIKASLATIF